jgi:predicted P-loop ATPase
MSQRRYRKSRIRREVASKFFLSARLLSQLKRYAMLMAVMAPMPREKWTDERLDDLKVEMHRGFAETKAEIADTKTEMRAGFNRVDTEIRGLRSEMNARFEAANRNLIAVTVAIIAAVIGSNAAFYSLLV